MLNLRRLKKDEILWLSNHKCQHHHTYLQHPDCFEREKPEHCPIDEKIGFLDIETTGLNANWDYIISYAIKVDKKFLGRVCKRNEVLNPDILDKFLLRESEKSMQNLDRIVVYWGTNRRHDLPFLRTRTLKWDVKFPIYKEVSVSDCYDIVKGKLKLHRNRLENVANFLKIPAKGHRLDAEMWQRAKLGDEKALRYVWLHNKEDVITLEAVYNKLKEFSSQAKTSI
jgi:uncharacterized protein YprB with RNaseH-like and TPR domain